MNIERKDMVSGIALVMREQLASRDERIRNLEATLAEMTTNVSTMVERAVGEAVDRITTETASDRRKLMEAASNTANELQAKTIAALERAANVQDGRPGKPGPKGDPGERGAPGGIAAVPDYLAGEIYRAGELVNLPRNHPAGWAIAECLSDTYDPPGDEDSDAWRAVVFHGARGVNPTGEHVTGKAYAPNDLVRSDTGAQWRRTVAGVSEGCPGHGWELFVRQGSKGARGERGIQGSPGRNGIGIADIVQSGREFSILLDDGEVRTFELPVVEYRDAPNVRPEGLP